MLKYRLKKIPRKKKIVWTTMILMFVISLGSIVGFYAAGNPFPNAGVTPIVGETVVVNDLAADWNYYMGLNYAEVTDKQKLPGTNANFTGALSTNKYNINTLVAVQINYSGVDINRDAQIGFVSRNERQLKYTYYKYVPIVDGKVKIELIDNPFTVRPNSKGFNGWVCDDENATSTVNCSDVTFSYDDEYYLRYATVPAPVADANGDKKLVLNLKTNWAVTDIKIDIGEDDVNSTINSFDAKSMQPILGSPVYEDVPVYQIIRQFKDNIDYYEYSQTIDRWDYVPNGLVCNNINWFGSCNSGRGCDCFAETSDSTVDENTRYYVYRGNSYVEATEDDFNDVTTDVVIGTRPEVVGYEFDYVNGELLTGYFYKITNFSSVSEADKWLYYDANGISCDISDSCGSEAYKLIQYSDPDSIKRWSTTVQEDGTIVTNTDYRDYYYLVTRDTNILDLADGVYDASIFSSKSQPFTITGSYNGSESEVTVNFNNIKLSVGEDMVIENVTMYGPGAPTGASDSLTTTYAITANYQNFKVARTITWDGRLTAYGIVGAGSNSDSDYKGNVLIEAGYYRFAKALDDDNRDGQNLVLKLGNDYDRVTGNNNKLLIYFEALSSDGGSHDSTSIVPTSEIVIKSGLIGSYMLNYGGTGTPDSYYMYGIYVGAHSSGSSNSLRTLKVEGGQVFSVNGGPCIETNYTGNVIGIYVTGGTVQNIVGGAGVSETYGNRIISITGGTIANSVAGGSNSYSGTSNPGPMNGKTLVYVGGNATLGSTLEYVDDRRNNRLYGVVEAGTVFGAGLGQSDSTTRGIVGTSHVIIDGSATIKGSVYGGGNYGASGTAATDFSFTATLVDILGGNIEGSVYGAANNNGAGQTYGNVQRYASNTANSGRSFSGWSPTGVHLNNKYCNSDYSGYSNGKCTYYTQDRYGGYVFDASTDSFIARDSLTSTIAHFLNINMYGGVVDNSVYGGSNTTGTVNGDVNINMYGGTVNVGVYGGGKGEDTIIAYDTIVNTSTTNDSGLLINEIYGGSELGSVNTSGDTSITINGGKIGTVYGGGKGSTTVSPNTDGDITVSMLDGDVDNIFGGNNIRGIIDTNSVVNVSGGNVGTVYGGSDGSLLANSGATTERVVGANNTNVNVSGGIIEVAVYGGGKSAPTTGSSTVNITGGTFAQLDSDGYVVAGTTPAEVFGGGEAARVTTTNVNILDGANVYNVYGGSNKSGVVNTTYVNNTGGNVLCNSYGGGKIAESLTTNSNLNGTNYTYVLREGETAYSTLCGTAFGGGANANVTTANITLNAGSMINVYGGSNEGGTVTDTNVLIKAGTVDNVFGGNNQGGSTVDSLINIEATSDNALSVNNVFGGSNGFDASISNTTTTNLKSGIVKQDVFGGGNQARVVKATYVNMYGGEARNIYGGGNRSFVGDVEVNSSGDILENAKENATLGNTYVNIVNGIINENVYGSSNASFVIGNTKIKIGDVALDYLGINDNVQRRITINGSVFAGSETNATESTVYLDSYEGVTGIREVLDSKPDENVDGGTGLVEIDGSSYIVNNASVLTIDGSIYGSGNNSKVLNGSDIYINKFGTREHPNVSISIQRADNVYVTDSHMELTGTVDRADPDSYRYSLIRLDGLHLLASTRDSGSYMYLRQGTARLKSLYSGAMQNGTFVPQKVTDNNGTLEVSVSDNRIYMLTNKILSISNSDAPVYDTTTTTAGPITGMTFLGMYTHDGGGNYVRGIYDYSYGNGSTYSEAASGVISKKAYTFAYGLNLTDYTMDEQIVTHGFYTNAVERDEDEEEEDLESSDDGKTLNYEYIGVTPANETTLYYKWVLGLEPIEIVVDLIADKYSESGAVNALISLDELKETVLGPNGNEIKQEWRDAVMTIQSVDTTSFGATEFDATRAFDGILVDKSDIPTINTADENDDGVVDANNYFALSMGTTSAGWLNNYKTNFYDNEYVLSENSFCDTANGNCTGNQIYLYDSTSVQRNLSFWLYHSKNLDFSYVDKSVDDTNMLIPMNKVYIEVEFRNPHGDPTLATNTVNVRINVNISLSDGELDNYGGIIAPGKKYEVFQGRPATIASNGSFSIYQSLSLDLTKIKAGTKNEYWNVGKLYHGDKVVQVEDHDGNVRNVQWGESYRYLNSSYLFPVGTVITMLDLKNNEQYYYEVTQENYNAKLADYQRNNITKYLLEDFVRMGSVTSNNKFDDDMREEESAKYYYHDDNNQLAVEEFIFNVDFSGAEVEVKNATGDQYYFYLELGRKEDGADKVVISTKGTPSEQMVYKLMPQVSSVINTTGGYVQEDGSTSQSTTIYVGESADLELDTSLIQMDANGQQLLGVSDTVFDEYKLGAKITIKRPKVDEDGNVSTTEYDFVTNDLFGTVMEINGQTYYPQTDGSTRIELAGRITDVISNINIDFSNASLAYGDYVLVVETFVSYDGLYYGDFEPTNNEFPFELLNNQYGLDVKTETMAMVTHDVNTGEDSEGNLEIHYIVDVVNGLSDPNLKISVSRRDYTSTYGTKYEVIPLTNLFDSVKFEDSEDNVLASADVCFNTVDNSCYIYNLSDITNSSIHKTYDVYMKLREGPDTGDLGDNKPNAKWKSGTYKVSFMLYDGDVLVGSVYEYLIIRSLGVDEIVIEGSGN